MFHKGCVLIAKVFVAAILSIALTSVVAVCYYYNGVHRPNPSGATDYTWEPNQIKVDNREGNVFLRFDEHGFNNACYDADRPVDILVIGDSNIEAAHVAANQSMIYLLNAMEPSLYTYSLGLGGQYIYACVQNLENAVREYAPSTCVVIDTNTVSLDMTEMQKAIDGTVEKKTSYDKGVSYLMQKWMPSVKLIYKQMSEWITLEMIGGGSSISLETASDAYRETLRAFLTKAASIIEARGIKLMILYIPVIDMDAQGRLVFDTDPEALAVFEKECEAQGILFVDPSEALRALYDEQHVMPCGFPNARVVRSHLNQHGHRIIAQELLKVIENMKE